MSPDDLTLLLVGMMVLSYFLWLVPSCGDPECQTAHQRHAIKDAAARIEKEHNVFHDPQSRPTYNCALCAAWRRDRDKES